MQMFPEVLFFFGVKISAVMKFAAFARASTF